MEIKNSSAISGSAFGRKKYIIIGIAVVFLLIAAAILKFYVFKPEVFETDPNFIKNISTEKKAELEARKITQLEFIKDFPDYYEAYLDLGNIDQILGNYADALKYYNKASQIIPSSSIPVLNKASLYVETGKLDKAYKAYWQSQKASPDYYLPYQKIIDFYNLYYKDKIGDIDEVYRMGLDNTKNDPDLLRAYGNYLMKNNRLFDAKQIWETLLSIYPADQYAQQKLGEVNKAMESN